MKEKEFSLKIQLNDAKAKEGQRKNILDNFCRQISDDELPKS